MKTVTYELRADGCAYDANGVMVIDTKTNCPIDVQSQKTPLKVRDVADLKSEGFNADDIIEMHKAGVI